MRRIKRIAALLLAGFFAFAPPGTLIFGLLLFLSLIKNFWVRLALVGLGLAAAAWLLTRWRLARRTTRKDTPTARHLADP